MKKLFTSEAVTEGHPDKVCDRVSDSVLDAVLSQDPMGRVACETVATTGMVILTGEITTTANVDYSAVARKAIIECGYDRPAAGFDGNSCAVLLSLDRQSPDIAMGTNDAVGGAGDQGMMFGYACTETSDMMPLPISLANRLAYRLACARKNGEIQGIWPDGKTQVTISYGEDGMPDSVDTIVISTQHSADKDIRELREELERHVVYPVLKAARQWDPFLSTDECRLLVNPTGRFVKGGPSADSGLTGRKIIADTYGGYAAHGGGAFSGKDPTKVDRSAAYAARHVAKNIVAARLADRCQVQLAYAIGVAEPVSIRIDTYGTGQYPDEDIARAVEKTFDLTPMGIIKRLDLRQPVYVGTSSYGHFGDVICEKRTWELVDYADELRRNTWRA